MVRTVVSHNNALEGGGVYSTVDSTLSIHDSIPEGNHAAIQNTRVAKRGGYSLQRTPPIPAVRQNARTELGGADSRDYLIMRSRHSGQYRLNLRHNLVHFGYG